MATPKGNTSNVNCPSEPKNTEQDIRVQVKDGKSFWIKLNPSEKLSQIRKKLSVKLNWYIDSNKDLFIYKSGYILSSDEDTRTLMDTLEDDTLSVVNYSSELKNTEQDIRVQLKDGKSFWIKLNLNEKLSRVREKLSEKLKWHIDSGKDLFTYKSGYILSSDEDTRTLEDILEDDHQSKDRVLNVDYQQSVVERYKLEYGVCYLEGELKQASKKAFKLVRFESSESKNTGDYIVSTNHEIDKICSGSLIAKAKLKTFFPWALALDFGSSHTTQEKTTNSKRYNVYKRSRRIIKITEAVPTDEFIEEVTGAIKSDNPRAKLLEVCDNFGHYWSKIVHIGGRLVECEKSSSDITNKNVTSQGSAQVLYSDACIAVEGEAGYSRENTMTAIYMHETSNRRVFGGDGNFNDQDGIAGWEKSLDESNWDVVEYEELVPIFEILKDKTMKKDILKKLGPVILHSQLEEVQNNKGIYVRELGIPDPIRSQLKDCQIFATIMRNEDDTKNENVVFASHVENWGTAAASIVVHRFPSSKDKDIKPCLLKIGWAIVGPIPDFNFECQWFRMSMFSGSECLQRISRRHKEISADPAFLNSSATLIANPVLQVNQSKRNSHDSSSVHQVNQSKYNPYESKIIYGVHLGSNVQGRPTLCAWASDVKKEELINDSLIGLPDLSVHYCSIEEYDDVHGQMSTEWEEKKRFLLGSKIFMGTPSDHNGHRLFNEAVHPVFLTLTLTSCPEKCVPGVINWSPSHMVFRAINGERPDKRALVSYLVIH